MLLSNRNLLAGTGFVFKTVRFDVDKQNGETEREFARKLKDTESHVDLLEKTVKVPALIQGLDESPRSTWIKRIWIRTYFEEISHVAQALDVRAGGRGLLSRKLNEDRSLRKRIDNLAREINALMLGGTFSAPVPVPQECDVYAFMIEALGKEFVPAWTSADNSHRYRALIDEDDPARLADWHLGPR